MTQKNPTRRWMKSMLAEAARCEAPMPWARANRKPLAERRAAERPQRTRSAAR